MTIESSTKTEIELQVEDFCELADELLPIFQRHYDEITECKESKGMAVNWPVYRALTDEGVCVTVTARIGGELAGYHTALIHRHQHHANIIIGICDLFYVDAKHRGKGVAQELIKRAEYEMRQRGATMATMAMKTNFDFSPLLERNDYFRSEIVWEKVLED